MTDFRALCAELHAAFNTYAVDEAHHDLLVRARAALAQPEPGVPTDRELTDTFYGNCRDTVTGLRAVLARWGGPAIKPVPVTERLPGPEDTTDRNECWYWHPGEECWEMVPVVTHTVDEWTHWLPHHALPVPQP